jgi:hypothetical protein
MQWSVLTEEKQKNQLAQTEFRFIKTIIIIRGGNYPTFFALTSALHCSKRRQISRWPWRADRCSGVCCLKESKRINLRKTKAAAITCRPSPLYQRCTAAKNGKVQGRHCQQRNAVEFFDRIQNLDCLYLQKESKRMSLRKQSFVSKKQ